jgi:ATP-dependent protease HslVU (ClpYQ) peptidase subunit
MSIVCCKINEQTIDIASDSIIVRGYTQDKGNNKFSKLFQTNGLTIGACGVAEETSLIQMYCKTRQPRTSDEDSILDFMGDFLDWKKKKTNNYTIDNTYILVCEGKAFSIHRFFVEEVKTFQAIGAGMDYALSALYLGHTVDKAIQTACELSIYCELPMLKYSVAKHVQ